MTQTQCPSCGDHLEAMKRAGQISEWWFERWTFKLADDCRYTPDFIVQALDGSLTAEEVKGHWRDDARVKTRVYAHQFPIPIRVGQLKKGQWTWESF